jgi:hypothetical protein
MSDTTMPAKELRKNLRELTRHLQMQRAEFQLLAADGKADYSTGFNKGMAGGIEASLHILHIWTNGEFGAAS